MLLPRGETQLRGSEGMFERWGTYFVHLSGLPGAVRNSLHPATLQDALRIQAQINRVKNNVMALDYALPAVGAAIIFVHSGRAPLIRMMACLAAVVFASFVNEAFLLRRRPGQRDSIADIRKAARILTLAASLLMGSWGAF